MIKIEINSRECIGCKACEEVCPSLIFSCKGSSLPMTISIFNPDSCISCGHCVAICPKNAITHSNFTEDKVHGVESINVDSQELLNLIKIRRSNRTFTKKEIPQEKLDMIIEAAYRAPTASNLQGLKFILIKDKAILEQIIDLTIGHYKGMLKLIDNPIVRPIATRVNPVIGGYIRTFKRMESQRQEGKDPILRGAKALLIIYTDKNSRFGTEDANLAYQNGSLMAESLGVAQVYTGFVCNVAHANNKINKLLGIEGKIQAGMALGIPKRHFTKYIDKQDINLKTI